MWSVRGAVRAGLQKANSCEKNPSFGSSPHTIWFFLGLYAEGLEMSEGEGSYSLPKSFSLGHFKSLRV